MTQPDRDPPQVDVLDTGAAGGMAIRGGAFRTASYGAALLLSLASVPFMVRHLGPADWGRFVTVSSIIFIIGGITEAGLTNLGVREYSVLDAARRPAFLRSLVGLRFALTIAGVLVATLLVAVTGADEVVVQGTFIAGVGLLLQLTQQTYMVPLTAQLRLGWVSILELLKQFVISALIVALVIAGASLVPFFAAGVVAGLVILGFTFALVRSEASLRPSFDRAAWWAILRETLPYAAAAAVGLVYFRLAVILMSYVSSDEETGIYGAAFRIVEVLGVIPFLVVSSAFPILARAAQGDEERLRYGIQRVFEVATILGVGIALVLAAGAHFAIEVVAGLPEFEESVPVLRIQALALITSFLVATWLFALLSLKLYRQLLWANALAAVVAAGATLGLAPSMGAEGAAIATVAAEAALVIAALVALVRARPGLRPSFGVLPKVIMAAALGGAAALALPAHAAVLAAVAGVVYLLVLALLRAIPAELVAALRGRDFRAPEA